MTEYDGVLLIDDREDDDEMLRNVERVCEERDLTSKIERLETGDYVYQGKDRRAAIEYKQINDAADSCTGDDPKLIRQANRIAKNFDWGAIWIAGQIDELDTLYGEMTYGQMHGQIVGTLSELQATMNIPVNWVHSRTVAADVGIRALVDAVEEDPQRAQKLMISPGVATDTRMALLMGIDKLGAAAAKRLLDKFGSVNAIASARFDELESVDGIGEKLARRIYNTFHTEWNGPGFDPDHTDGEIWEFLNTRGVGDDMLRKIYAESDELEQDVEEVIDEVYPDIPEHKREKIVDAAEG